MTDLTPLDDESDDFEQIALVGIAGRYPSSPDINAFWENIRKGRDCLQTFSDEELEAHGISAKHYGQPNFVPRGSELPDARGFDAKFFGFTPQEAAMMDPQSRIFLETCWEALEDSGYEPTGIDEAVGVFAGSNPNDYAALLGVADPSDSLTAFNQLIGSDKDFLATRVSHRLNLRGPALTLQTACSTSLVAVHLATQSLLNYECTMALAGGVTVNLRQGVGYFAQQGMILSPAGTCRAFDADAEGTTLGQGCGVAVLKRLSDAIADDDHIYAVVKASAINNDGSSKISYTAPSEDGQAEVISLAHQLAGIESDSIGLIEAHGTGTKLGDPVEIAALTRAFAPGTDRQQFCAIGSAKTNFGHTDAAAGITGFLKAALSLHHRELPPSIHFETPNPAIGFENTPFFVNTELREWERNGTPRRAGVSAFGIGGTNAHVILEEAPDRRTPAVEQTAPVIVPISAKSSEAADVAVARIHEALAEPDAAAPLDAAYTLRKGRARLPHRRALIASTTEPTVTLPGAVAPDATTLVALYPGQGMQQPGMTAGLYATENVYRRAFDACVERLEDDIAVPLRDMVLSANPSRPEFLDETWLTQPALFTVEYALTQLFASWGISPDVVVGHSIGEFAAAVEAGVFTLDAAVAAVAERGRLMWSMPPGSMAAIFLGPDEVANELPADVVIAALNSPNSTVVSGPDESIERLVTRLEQKQIRSTPLRTSHAFHSPMMQDAATEFASFLSGLTLAAPQRPMVSNVTGTWLTDAEATSADFWASQIRNPVRFAECLTAVASKHGGATFIELGPGRAMSAFADRNPSVDPDTTTIATTAVKPSSPSQEQIEVRSAVAQLWCAGVEPDWDALGQGTGQRVPLPTYPFDRVEHWSPANKHQLALPQFGELTGESTIQRNPADEWLWLPTWSRVPYEEPEQRSAAQTALAFLPSTDEGDKLEADLRAKYPTVLAVRPAELFAVAAEEFLVRPGNDGDMAALAAELHERNVEIDIILHAWTLRTAPDPSPTNVDRSLDLGLNSVLSIGRHLVPMATSVHLLVATNGSAQVFKDELVVPSNSVLVGAARVLGLEYAATTARVVDITDDSAGSHDELLSELDVNSSLTHVAIRAGSRWIPDVIQLPASRVESEPTIRNGGHYLIVGGTGGVGLSLAKHLSETYGARLSLTSRSGFPEADETSSPETRRRVDALKSLDPTGGRVSVFAADVSSLRSMQTAVSQAEARFGPIHGVISAAGVADQGGVIQRRSTEQMRDSILSKVHGSLVLADVFDGYGLDFLALSSSVAATLWHNRFAQVGYVVANSFVEALPLSRPDLPIVTIAWDDWTEIGMSVRAAEDFTKNYGEGVQLVDELNSFSPAEGVRVFEQVLGAQQPVVVVSPTDLRDRIRDDVHQVSPFLNTAVGKGDSGEGGAEGTVADVVRSSWSDLLGYDDIADSDDFFELGGDSLQSARLADRLSRRLSIEIPLQLIFTNSSLDAMTLAISEVIEVDDRAEGDGKADDAMRAAPLSPAQKRFLSRKNPNPDHFNISTLLEPSSAIDAGTLEAVVRAVVAVHPALRTMLDIESSTQRTAPAEDWQHFSTCVVKNADELAEVCEEKQRSLSLTDGHVLDVTLIEREDTGDVRILLVVHHFVSDRISLLLLIDTLSDLYALASEGKPLPKRSLPAFGQWVRELEALAHSPTGEAGEQALLALPWKDVKPIRQGDQRNRNSDGNAVRLALPSAVSKGLLESDVASTDELLLAGLLQSLSTWAGGNAASVEVLNHGRRILDGVDVSRSVGFFLSYAPVVLPAASMETTCDAVAELRRQQEFNKLYDPIRFYGSHSKTSSLRRPDVLFNYVGRKISAPSGQLFQPTSEPRGAEVDVDGNRDHAIAVLAEVDEDSCVVLTFVYSEALHTTEEVERLVGLVQENVSSSLVAT